MQRQYQSHVSGRVGRRAFSSLSLGPDQFGCMAVAGSGLSEEQGACHICCCWLGVGTWPGCRLLSLGHAASTVHPSPAVLTSLLSSSVEEWVCAIGRRDSTMVSFLYGAGRVGLNLSRKWYFQKFLEVEWMSGWRWRL